jgi:hypothetical protein
MQEEQTHNLQCTRVPAEQETVPPSAVRPETLNKRTLATRPRDLTTARDDRTITRTRMSSCIDYPSPF